jgi:hypothetical protein
LCLFNPPEIEGVDIFVLGTIVKMGCDEISKERFLNKFGAFIGEDLGPSVPFF